MPRYVDAEHLKTVLIPPEVSNSSIAQATSTIIDFEPTADVEPIVHAHWIRHEWAEEVEGRLIPNYECSHCHEWFRDNRRRCGECGARMDEEVK